MSRSREFSEFSFSGDIGSISSFSRPEETLEIDDGETLFLKRLFDVKEFRLFRPVGMLPNLIGRFARFSRDFIRSAHALLLKIWLALGISAVFSSKISTNCSTLEGFKCRIYG